MIGGPPASQSFHRGSGFGGATFKVIVEAAESTLRFVPASFPLGGSALFSPAYCALSSSNIPEERVVLRKPRWGAMTR